MKKVYYFHWNKEEAAENVKRVSSLGFNALHYTLNSLKEFAGIKKDPPDVFLIDLSRLPSHGREVGTALRAYKSTREVPIVFLGGEKEKVERVKQILPDAYYAEWRNLKSTISRALKSGAGDVIIKNNVMDAYSGTPLITKLGIKEGMCIRTVNSPKNINTVLGKLPAKVKFIKSPKGKSELTMWFVKEVIELQCGIENVIGLMKDGGALWIFWQKQKGKVRMEITQQDVRSVGLKNGLVDFKVCSFDEVWSGLKFVRRKK